MECSLGISNFLEEISTLSHSVIFLYFFALIAEEDFLISPGYSLELYSNGNIFPFLLCFSLLFFSQLFVRPPQTTILPFCISFPWGWSWSLTPVQCHEQPGGLPSMVSQRVGYECVTHAIGFLTLYFHFYLSLGIFWFLQWPIGYLVADCSTDMYLC